MTPVRTFSAALVAALLMSLLAAPTPAGAAARHGYAEEAFVTVNKRRDDRDLRLLKHGACLNNFAKRQARRMARQKRVFHQSLQTVQAACDFEYVGEAIVAGYRRGRVAVNRGLMSTRMHRKVLLDAKSRRMGVGAKKANGGGWYLCVLIGHR